MFDFSHTILIAGTLALSGVVLAAEVPTINLARWAAPDITTVGDDPLGKLVKYGHALVTDTANRIGPTVSDPALRFAGNNLNCQSCHLKGGTQAYAMPLVGVWGQFPQYRGREGDVVLLEVRING
jgi:thiosulfate dehydrogenase